MKKWLITAVIWKPEFPLFFWVNSRITQNTASRYRAQSLAYVPLQVSNSVIMKCRSPARPSQAPTLCCNTRAWLDFTCQLPKPPHTLQAHAFRPYRTSTWDFLLQEKQGRRSAAKHFFVCLDLKFISCNKRYRSQKRKKNILSANALSAWFPTADWNPLETKRRLPATSNVHKLYSTWSCENLRIELLHLHASQRRSDRTDCIDAPTDRQAPNSAAMNTPTPAAF